MTQPPTRPPTRPPTHSGPEPPDDPRLLRARRLALALGSLAFALAVSVGWLLGEPAPAGSDGVRVVTGGPGPRPEGQDLDAAMRAAIDVMVAEARGIMDNHPDPDVGRVLQPRLEGAVYRGTPVSTNDDGMRSQTIERPKPEGRVRVVLLGDSYVFGWGVPGNRSVGRLLQQHLRRELPDVDLEVLSLAVPSWNLRAQSTWLRRQASLLEADLVFVHVCDNDLDDNLDVRGFGSLASSSSQQRGRADALVWRNYSLSELGAERSSPLLLGFDHESRSRWERAVSDVARLRDAVAASGGRTALLLNLGVHASVANQHLVQPLGDVPVVWIPPRFSTERENLLGERDVHWSESGHGRIAELLYGGIEALDLLPGLALPRWEPGAKEWNRLHRSGEFQAVREDAAEELLSAYDFVARLEPRAGGGWPGAFQVYGGLDAEGRLGPFACLVLPADGGDELVVELAGLGRDELPSVRLSVEVEEHRLGSLELAADDASVVQRFALPAGLAGRRLLAVRLAADGWVYAADDLRHNVSARLVRVGLE